MFGDEELIKIHRDRGVQVANIILFCFGVIFVRLWYLQIYKGEIYENFSNQNRLRKEVIPAPRGMIFDRNEELLVDNRPRFDAILTRQFLQDKKETLGRLAKILSMEVDEVKRIIKKYSSQAKYRPIIIKKNISHTEVAKIETENESLPGVSVNTFISREYIDQEVGAHVLGYISEISQTQLPKYKKRDDIDYRLGDFIGQFGIEEIMDKQIRGDNGFEYVEVDALGRKKKNTGLFMEINDRPEKQGNNLRLTIDREMQKVAYKALEGKSGSVVAIDVNTGEILTMISTPSFQPSQFSRGLTTEYWNSLIGNEEKPLRDRSIQNHFPPGSTFKAFTAIAGLEKGIIERKSQLRCHGSFKFGRRVYRSWKRYGTEKVTVEDALRQSCNIFFYKVAAELDIDDLAKYADMFGLGKRTGIALPREVSGLIPTKEWKQNTKGEVWQQGETLSCAIGQSYVLVSTLQLANAYAAIATKGKLYKPYIVKEVFDQQNNIIASSQPELLNEIKLKEETWDLVRSGLYKVVNDPKGTAWWRRGKGNQMAGKTGTSQVVKAQSTESLYAKCAEKDYKNRHHGVFVAFAPFDKPKIAVAALVEHGCKSSAAAQVVEKVVHTYMKKYLPEDQKKYEEMEKKQYTRYIKKRALKLKKQKAAQEAEEDEEQVPAAVPEATTTEG
jgi:penicillin-binding protein 2